MKHLQKPLPFSLGLLVPTLLFSRAGQVHTHSHPTHLNCGFSKQLCGLEQMALLTSRKTGAETVRPSLTQCMWVIIPKMETETYPIDVPLAVVAVAASREGVILSIKLLWLVKQDKQSHEWKAENLPKSLSPSQNENLPEGQGMVKRPSQCWGGGQGGGRAGHRGLQCFASLPIATNLVSL